jgi:hypothetical protein
MVVFNDERESYQAEIQHLLMLLTQRDNEIYEMNKYIERLENELSKNHISIYFKRKT